MGEVIKFPKKQVVPEDVIEGIFSKMADLEILRRENAELIKENLRLKKLLKETRNA